MYPGTWCVGRWLLFALLPSGTRVKPQLRCCCLSNGLLRSSYLNLPALWWSQLLLGCISLLYLGLFSFVFVNPPMFCFCSSTMPLKNKCFNHPSHLSLGDCNQSCEHRSDFFVSERVVAAECSSPEVGKLDLQFFGTLCGACRFVSQGRKVKVSGLPQKPHGLSHGIAAVTGCWYLWMGTFSPSYSLSTTRGFHWEAISVVTVHKCETSS